MRIRKRSSCDSGSGIRSVVLDRILRRQHEERFRQRVRVVVDCDLRFVHRFQQRRLRFRRRAVDFVGHDDVRENRPRLELEFLRRGIVDAHADHVARQQIGGELNALERALKRIRQRLRQRRLAHARHVLDQQVAAREQRRQRKLNHVFLALDDAPNRALQFRQPFRRRGGAAAPALMSVVVCNSVGLLLQKLSRWFARSMCTRRGNRVGCCSAGLQPGRFFFGRLAQLVRAFPSHGRGPRFKSLVAHHAPLQFCHHSLDAPPPVLPVCAQQVVARGGDRDCGFVSAPDFSPGSVAFRPREASCAKKVKWVFRPGEKFARIARALALGFWMLAARRVMSASLPGMLPISFEREALRRIVN